MREIDRLTAEMILSFVDRIASGNGTPVEDPISHLTQGYHGCCVSRTLLSIKAGYRHCIPCSREGSKYFGYGMLITCPVKYALAKKMAPELILFLLERTAELIGEEVLED